MNVYKKKKATAWIPGGVEGVLPYMAYMGSMGVQGMGFGLSVLNSEHGI